jgi:glycosyltransferase involved in cell wall biosynthesis
VLLIAACAFPCARGTAARVLGQALALRRHGVDVTVATYDLAEFDPPAGLPVWRIPRVPTHRSTRPGPSLQKLALLDPLLAALTWRVARDQRPHVLHGHHVEGALLALGVGKRLGLPVVFDAHTSLAAELPTYGPAGLESLLRRSGAALDAFLTRRSAHVFAVTEALRAELLTRAGPSLDPERVSVAPMGLELEAIAPEARTRRPKDTPPTIVYAGGLSRFQRLDLLGRAFERVQQEIPDATLLVLSPDPAESLFAVWPRGRSCPGVRCLHPPNLERTFQELDAADLAVSPRTAGGGFPLKNLNYMARGLPVVACRGSAEPLRHGETGWIVPDDDPAAFATALLELLRDPSRRQQLAAAARREAAGRFGWDRVVEPMLQVYEGLVVGPPAG